MKYIAKHTLILSLWNSVLLTNWLLLQGIFETFDKDRSGRIDSNELRDALLFLLWYWTCSSPSLTRLVAKARLLNMTTLSFIGCKFVYIIKKDFVLVSSFSKLQYVILYYDQKQKKILTLKPQTLVFSLKMNEVAIN